MILKLWIRLLVFLSFASAALLANASDQKSIEWTSTTAAGEIQVHLYFFWSPHCPHCQKAREFIEPLPADYDWIKLHSFNVFNRVDNARLYQQMADALGETARSVPAMLVCGRMITGWDHAQGIGQMLVEISQQCRTTGLAIDKTTGNSLRLPLLGEISIEAYSLPVLTLVIAGVDAFNPCAFFILLFLLSLLVHARSRKRMLLVGGTFVLVSGLVYFIFMAAWLNLFLIVGSIGWITIVAGTLAIIIGLFGIKDFFLFLKGPSLSISENAKPELFKRMRQLLTTDNLATLLVGTFTLAIVANSYELLCTAGFPMVYTHALTLHPLSSSSYYLYLLFYNLVYITPLILIVLLFTFSLGRRKLSPNEGRLLKLLSGIMMFELGLLLLVHPQALSNVFTGIGLLLIAIVFTLVAGRFLKLQDGK